MVQHATNEGLGSSFQEAVRLAIENKADILVNIDGDGAVRSWGHPKLVGPIVNRKADMASASRFLERDLVPEMPAVKKWGNRAVAGVVRLLTGKRFWDVSCGFRAFSREALLRMNLFGSFTYTQESFLDLAFKEMKLLEVPIQVRGTREFGESRIASSIPRYAVRSLLIMLRAFISYKPFRLFSAISLVFFFPGAGPSHFSLGALPEDRGVHSAHLGRVLWAVRFASWAFSLWWIGLLGDILVRIRLNQENMLYAMKKADWEARPLSRDPDTKIPNLTG